MGLQAGWRDVYPSSLAFQWIDVTAVAPGRYLLTSVVDPDDRLVEASEANNDGEMDTAVPVAVPGYETADVDISSARPMGTAVVLAAHKVTDPLAGAETIGPPEFKIVRMPRHGVIDREPGDWFRDPGIVYRPTPPGPAADELEFAVRDSAHPLFPRVPSHAVVRIAGRGERPAAR